MAILLCTAALMLLTGPGGAGSSTIQDSDNPLPLALRSALGEDSATAVFVNYVGLAGLIASFFSIVFAYSRQLFALSRSGATCHAGLSVTNARKTPHMALIVPGTIGFLLAASTRNGALLINIAVFGATVSYVLMMVSHIVLRRKEPELERPFRTPGGVVTTRYRPGARRLRDRRERSSSTSSLPRGRRRSTSPLSPTSGSTAGITSSPAHRRRSSRKSSKLNLN